MATCCWPHCKCHRAGPEHIRTSPRCAFQWPEWRIPPDRHSGCRNRTGTRLSRGLPPDFSSEAGVLLVDGADVGPVYLPRTKVLNLTCNSKWPLSPFFSLATPTTSLF